LLKEEGKRKLQSSFISTQKSSSIRSFKIVIDTENVFAPELTLEDFIKIHGKEPSLPRYRIIKIEVVTCPEDQQPVLVTECAKCPKFIRRFKNQIYCYEFI